MLSRVNRPSGVVTSSASIAPISARKVRASSWTSKTSRLLVSASREMRTLSAVAVFTIEPAATSAAATTYDVASTHVPPGTTGPAHVVESPVRSSKTTFQR